MQCTYTYIDMDNIVWMYCRTYAKRSQVAMYVAKIMFHIKRQGDGVKDNPQRHGQWKKGICKEGEANNRR